MTNLTSRNNPRIKQVRLLRQRKQRQQTGLFVVEGIRPVGEALQSGTPVEYIVYDPERLSSDFACQLIRDQLQRGLPCLAVDRDLFASLAEKDNPQGILAVANQPRTGLAQLNPTNCPWGVALISPQDPGNIGTILRTIDAVGASALFLLDESADPYQNEAVRASMGALFWHPLVQASFVEFAAWTGLHGYHVYGTSAHGSVDYHAVSSYFHPLILLLGSERQGLNAEQAALCQQLIKLPMRGRVTSLNLAVAAGVMLYSMLERISP